MADLDNDSLALTGSGETLPELTYGWKLQHEKVPEPEPATNHERQLPKMAPSTPLSLKSKFQNSRSVSYGKHSRHSKNLPDISQDYAKTNSHRELGNAPDSTSSQSDTTTDYTHQNGYSSQYSSPQQNKIRYAHSNMQVEQNQQDRTDTRITPPSSKTADGVSPSPPHHSHRCDEGVYHLYEYEKPRDFNDPGIYSDRLFHDSHYNIMGSDNEKDCDDDDREKLIMCSIFCIISIIVVFGLIIFLYNYAEKAALEQKQQYNAGGLAAESELNCLDIKNFIHHRRISDIILKASEEDSYRSSQFDQNGLSLSRSNRVWKPNPVDRSSRMLQQQHQHQLQPQYRQQLDVCAQDDTLLVGKISSMNLSLEVDISEVLKNNSDIREGGEWQPSTCISRHRVAIIVPYRDRWSHLKTLLYYLLPILKRQQIHFRIFVVEQYGNDTFNKGRIMNAAFREAVKLFDFQCVTFHDVDLVPEDDRNMYSCTQQPKHMSIAIDKFLYVLPYQGLVGGVLSFHSSHFQQVNGYSNMYWGWGAEDDDMTTRILHRGLRIYRPPSNIGRYKMVKHDGRKHSEMTVRMKLLRSAARRSKLEGLNNVQYKLVYAHNEKLFTHFMVDIGHP